MHRMKNKEWIIPSIIAVLATSIMFYLGIGLVIILFLIICWLIPVWFIIKYSDLITNTLIETFWERLLACFIICSIISVGGVFIYVSFVR